MAKFEIVSAEVMKVATTIALLAAASSASGLRIAAHRAPVAACRAAVVAAAPDEVRECLADAENLAEIEDCQLPGTAHAGSTSTAAPPAAFDADENRKEHLMGSAESILECLTDAENPAEQADCRSDFEELIGVPTGACVETENKDQLCNPEDIRTTDAVASGGGRAGAPTMLVMPCGRKAVPGKCIFRGDKCTGKRCKVNNAPCKTNHASV